MALGTSFKQQCPSCEAMVPVKDPAMVGQKIECPKCKDKFIVKSPSPKKDEEEDEDAPKAKPNSKGATGKAAAGKKPAQRLSVREADEDDEEPASAKGKKRTRGEDDDDEVGGKKG